MESIVKKRRNGIQYSEIESTIDCNGTELVVGDYINYNENGEIKNDGPITKILNEITGTADDSIKILIYVDSKIYFNYNTQKLEL